MLGSLDHYIAIIPALLIGFAFHEYSHAWMADRLGDPTPRSMGRLTLNPFVHLDIFGTILLIISGFGWAKPVQINPHYFKGDPIRGHMKVSLAGPMANFIIAFISMLVWGFSDYLLYNTSWNTVVDQVLRQLVFVNISLGVFNLFPIYPLDGYSILRGIIPSRYVSKLWVLEQYGMIILAVVLFTGIFRWVFNPVVTGIYLIYAKLISLVLSVFF